ncbi:MAG: DUF1552 domain-containing protein [Myxococcales bacterium]|nr:DUF1552 domain-containing protein [Myxococcales bacterium]MCB9712814.1 DUF1552 domain-containing protein [Myxococcales bacterium]
MTTKRIVRPAFGTTTRLGRRSFLRGSLGASAVCLGLPLLDIMVNDHATALAGGDPLPVRFGVFYWGGGVVRDTWVPTETGQGFALPDSLQPFAELRDYLTLITGTNHHNSSPGHIPARGIALSASHDPNTSIEGVGTWRGQNHPEPSVDALVAEHWQGLTPFTSVEVGICRKGPYKSNSSWKRGGDVYNRHEPDPVALYDRLFSMGVGEGEDFGSLGASRQLGRSMLDVVMEDATRLQARLGANDRQRMEQHLEGLRAIERRLDDYAASCQQPGAPAGLDYGDNGSNEQKEAKAQVMSELLAAALACDLTRIFSYEWSATQSEAVYWEVGIDQEHHQYNHDNSQGDGMKAITRFIMQSYAYLAEALRQRPEGAGTVLDNTLILGTSAHAIAGAHNYTDHPYLLVGGAGGGIKAGQHWRHPNPGGNEDAPKVLLTAVRAVGVEQEALGQVGGPGGVADRRVSEAFGEVLA